MSASSSPASLLEVLRRTAPTDGEAESALWQLRQMGPDAIEPALALLREPPSMEMRDHLAETLTLIFDDWQDDVRKGELRAELAAIFLGAATAGERALYAELLGDLGVHDSLAMLTAAAHNPQIHETEYEALRDAIERLDGVCPEIYFDEAGQAWQVEESGVIECLYCHGKAEPQGDGSMKHAAAAPGCPLGRDET